MLIQVQIENDQYQFIYLNTFTFANTSAGNNENKKQIKKVGIKKSHSSLIQLKLVKDCMTPFSKRVEIK